MLRELFKSSRLPILDGDVVREGQGDISGPVQGCRLARKVPVALGDATFLIGRCRSFRGKQFVERNPRAVRDHWPIPFVFHESGAALNPNRVGSYDHDGFPDTARRYASLRQATAA